MECPLVSVIMPVFNCGNFLDRSIRSIVDQTFSDFEFIIVDDGSTDNSLEIANDWASRDSRIQVYPLKHVGIAQARNAAIERANGKYLANNDADDFSIKHRLFEQVQFLNDNPDVVVVSSSILFVDPDGSPIERRFVPTAHKEIDSELLAGRGLSLTHSAMMFRRSTFIAIDGYSKDLEVCEDIDLCLKFAEFGCLANIPEILLNVTRHRSSVSKIHSQERLEKIRKLRERVVLNAYKRRGVAAPEVSIETVDELYREDETHLKWANAAYRNEFYSTALKYSVAAIKSNVLNAKTWVRALSVMTKTAIRKTVPKALLLKASQAKANLSDKQPRNS